MPGPTKLPPYEMGYLAFKWRTGKAKNPFTYDSPHWRRWWQGWFDRIRELIEHE